MAGMRNKLIVAFAAALVAVTVVAASADESPHQPPSDGFVQVTEVQPEAEDALAVLGEERSAEDALPNGVAEAIGEEADFGMNPDLSQLAIGNASSSVYVIPADGHVCAALTVGEGAGLICPDTETVAEGRAGPSTVALDGGAVGIYGVVPDGVESVTVHTGVSDSEEVEVSNNAYYLAVSSGTVLRSLGYTGPSGAVEFALADPTVAFEDPGQ